METRDIASISIDLGDSHVFIINASDLEVWSDHENDVHGMTWSGGDVLFDVVGEVGEDNCE